MSIKPEDPSAAPGYFGTGYAGEYLYLTGAGFTRIAAGTVTVDDRDTQAWEWVKTPGK
jgi:hypothetical protein